MKRILGLDIGVSSIGWAVVEVDEKDISKGDVIDAGVRLFHAAEKGKKMESPAKPRRKARGQRVRLYRRASRLKDIRLLFIRNGLLEKAYVDGESECPKINKMKITHFHHQQNAQNTPWELRIKGLDHKLEKTEWVAVLTHLAKRRGYRSNKKDNDIDEANNEEANEKKAVLGAIQKNEILIGDGKKYRTVAEMMAKDPRFQKNKRNRKKDKPQYIGVVTRKLLKEEINILFEKQRQFGNEHANNEMRDEYIDIWARQRSFDYRGNVEKMIGNCSFEPKEKRAPKAAFSAEFARLLQAINHLTVRDETGKERLVEVSAEAQQKIIALAKEKKEINYADIRKKLSLSCQYRFLDVLYLTEKKRCEKELERLSLLTGNNTSKKLSQQHMDTLREYGDKMVKAGKDIYFSDIRRELNLPSSSQLKHNKTVLELTKESEKAFFKFKQIQKLRNHIVKKLNEDYWNIISNKEALKNILLDAACLGSDKEDRRAFLQANGIEEEITEAVVSLSIADENEKNEKFQGILPGWHKIKEAFEAKNKAAIWEQLENADNNEDATEVLNNIAIASTTYKEEENIYNFLSEDKKIPLSFNNHADAIKEVAASVNLSQFGSLSITALRKIIPHLRDGKVYSAACIAEYGDHRQLAEKIQKSENGLPAYFKDDNGDKQLVVNAQEIRNPKVVRALSQARKVVNAVMQNKNIAKDGIHQIHIELLRDLARSADERHKIKNEQRDFAEKNENAAARFKEITGQEAKGGDLLKFRLWEEQSSHSPYSGKYLSPRRLVEDGYAEIDHILPLSRSLDNSQTNKILCLSSENQKKGNKTPYEWFGKDENRWAEFCERIKYYRIGRREKFLRKTFTADDAKDHQSKWVERAESKWIARAFKEILERHLTFINDEENNIKVQTRNGTLTSFIRAQWGISKKRDDDDLHHAVDAMVLAFSTQGMVKQVMEWSKRKEIWASEENEAALIKDEETGEIIKTRHKEMKEFYKKFPGNNLRKIILDKKSNIFVSRPPVCKLSMKAHDDTIKSVTDNMKEKMRQEGSLVRGGAPVSWEILRADIYEKDNRFYARVVRPYHHVKGILPNQLISRGKQEHLLTGDHQFKFSLYPGDAILIHSKASPALINHFPPERNHAGVRWIKDNKEIIIVGYYRMINAHNAQITLQAHDSSWGKEGNFHPAIMKLLAMHKLSIPILGNISMTDVIDKKKFIVQEKKPRELEKPRYNKPNSS